MDPPHTPTCNPPLNNHEATTRRKAKFFEACDCGRVNLGVETSVDTWWISDLGSPSESRVRACPGLVVRADSVWSTSYEPHLLTVHTVAI